MADENGLKEELQRLLDDLTEFMKENNVESVELQSQARDPEPRPEHIVFASNVQIVDIKKKPEKKE